MGDVTRKCVGNVTASYDVLSFVRYTDILRLPSFVSQGYNGRPKRRETPQSKDKVANFKRSLDKSLSASPVGGASWRWITVVAR